MARSRADNCPVTAEQGEGAECARPIDRLPQRRRCRLHVGNTNQARSKLEEATFSWNKVSVAISKRGAREPKLLLDSLDSKLRSGAPAAEVNSSIYIVLEELSEDIAAELR